MLVNRRSIPEEKGAEAVAAELSEPPGPECRPTPSDETACVDRQAVWEGPRGAADFRPRRPSVGGWPLRRGPLQWQRLTPDRPRALDRAKIRWLLRPRSGPRLRQGDIAAPPAVPGPPRQIERPNGSRFGSGISERRFYRPTECGVRQPCCAANGGACCPCKRVRDGCCPLEGRSGTR